MTFGEIRAFAAMSQSITGLQAPAHSVRCRLVIARLVLLDLGFVGQIGRQKGASVLKPISASKQAVPI